MKKTMFNIFLFTAGAAIGSVVTWKIVKNKYEQIIQDEIDSFKEDYVHCMRGEVDEDNLRDENGMDEGEEDEDSEMDIYRTLVQEYMQSGDDAENDGEGAGDEEVPYINGPSVITPEEFGNGNYNHSLYCLTYYSDGILSNDWYEQLDIDETIGQDSLEHFGDHAEEDVVHVRNERMGADYEVVRDPRRYSDIVANDPLTRIYAD